MNAKPQSVGINPEDLVIGCDELHAMMGLEAIRIVDLRPDKEVGGGFIPGSIRLDYDRLIRKSGKAEGLLPDEANLEQIVTDLGIDSQTRVVALDLDSGIRAARLLWTLAICGHSRISLLSGGFSAWQRVGYPVADEATLVEPSKFELKFQHQHVADLDYVQASLGHSDRTIVDSRSPGEYAGTTVKADRGGRIPGAIHYEWLNVLDENRGIRNAGDIQSEILNLEISPEHEIIPYCQSNRRSAHAWLVFNWLGYPRVRAYQGSWSEWGNTPEIPIE